MKKQFETIYNTYESEFSGVCCVKNGAEILFSGVSGFANRDFEIPNSLDTRFDTASVTKIFTSVAVLQLAEQGLLRLTDRIHEVIELSSTAIPKDVTIVQLLNHTSGIADDADEEAGEDYSALFIDKPNYSIRNCADFLPQFAYKEPVFKAGTNVRYNNCAFVLLGLAIEKLTNMNYRDYVAENIFKPAGMTNTYFGAKDEICPNTADGYFAVIDNNGNFIKWMKNIYSYPPIGTPDGGALTTVNDLDKFIRAIKCNVLLSAEYSSIMSAPHCEFSRPHKFGIRRTGYAFEFIESGNKTFCMYKEGINPGVNAIFSYYPELNISLSILSNQDGSFWKMYHDMQDILYTRFLDCGKSYIA
jgi:CubicO group peptidase (beta-lactamase class C family)